MELGTSTRAASPAAAAAQQRDQDAAAVELALGVCLQQPCFRQPDGRMVVTLLRVAKWLRALVARWCGGALVLRTDVGTPEQAQSLAAWLAQHGALLDELELRMHVWGSDYDWWSEAEAAQQRHKQHTAARLLGQVPSSLRRLALSGRADRDSGAQQAAALAAAFTRQPMQLCSLELSGNWRFFTAAVLPALAALGQLTSLVIWLPDNTAQLQLQMQHLPAQLQHLELDVKHGRLRTAEDDFAWLALEHVTGLTSLRMPAVHVDGGVLPRGLHALEVAEVSDVAPVLQLEQLTALQLGRYSTSAEQLRQLSTLRRLEQLSMSLLSDVILSDAAAVLRVLPLMHLDASNQDLTAACLEHLGACTRLTRLRLWGADLAPCATHEQVAAALAPLSALEDLELMCGRWPPAPWAQLCQALAGLPRLTVCNLSGVRRGPEVLQLTAVTQLTKLCVTCCELDDADVLWLSLCGLRGLRWLNLCSNWDVTDACLGGVAALSQLTRLDVFCTGVTRDGVQQLRAKRPQLYVLE